MTKSISFLLLILIFSCKDFNASENKETQEVSSETISDTATQNTSIADTTDINNNPPKDFREFKVLDSKYIRAQKLWEPFNNDLENFTEGTYNNLKPFILDQDIPTLQKHIAEGKLTYEQLTKFYLYRIRKFDRENPLSLNSVIALNPNVIQEAIEKDLQHKNGDPSHPIFGMPILLKDNINTANMPTTAGSVALANNTTTDAFIVKKLKEHGALILGKANLSEWAYFFCGDCPSGYSAIGGQTLNPYGRRVMDTGGSSSGSGVAVAANFCVAAVGSETSGSILSPASQNSTVGFKPTIGVLSRSGIVPISSTLDTAGPITKNVTDNAIMLDAMFGYDEEDSKSVDALLDNGFYYEILSNGTMEGKRLGAFKNLMEDSLYIKAISVLKQQGTEIIEIDEEKINLPDFLRLFNLDMKKDLPEYLNKYADASVVVSSVNDVIAFNKTDSLKIMPYGQSLFEGIVADQGTDEDLEKIKNTLFTNGTHFFEIPMEKFQLNGVLSINNHHAGFAAVAGYPAITVPMGYTEEGEPEGLTFIGTPLLEKFILQWAYNYEQASKARVSPVNYN